MLFFQAGLPRTPAALGRKPVPRRFPLWGWFGPGGERKHALRIRIGGSRGIRGDRGQRGRRQDTTLPPMPTVTYFRYCSLSPSCSLPPHVHSNLLRITFLLARRPLCRPIGKSLRCSPRPSRRSGTCHVPHLASSTSDHPRRKETTEKKQLL